jgi:hypothetical protein
MSSLSSTYGLGVAFNPFLFASISDDVEAPLSVVSALARLDIDPWQEAEALSQLQQAPAARRLAALLARSPGTSGDLDILVTRLVALLPRPSETGSAPPAKGWLDARITLDPRILILLFLITATTFVAGLSLTAARHSGPPDHPNAAPAGAPATPHPVGHPSRVRST